MFAIVLASGGFGIRVLQMAYVSAKKELTEIGETLAGLLHRRAMGKRPGLCKDQGRGRLVTRIQPIGPT